MDIHDYINRGERWVRDGAEWVKRHPKISIGTAIGVVALFWGVAFYNRKRIISAGHVLVDAAKKQFFLTVIPVRSRQFADAVLRASVEEGVSPFLLVAIMEHETSSGTSNLLDKPGPGGRGDGGHGHGLMQIDDRSWGDWLATNDWTDPYLNIKKGAQIYKGKRSYLKSKFPNLSEPELMAAALAAYNTGEGNVAKSIKASRPVDSTTANGNYSADVLTRIATMEAAFNRLAGSAA